MTGPRHRGVVFLRRASAAVLACFVAASGAITYAGLQDHVEPADAIVVLGNTVRPDGTPSARLQARLDTAAEVWRRHVAPLVIVSGGVGSEGQDEAAAMARALRAEGVPGDAIVEDASGADTAATAADVAAIARERRLRSVIVVSQYFHLPRARLALARAGLRVVGTVHARFFEWRDLYSLAREVVALPVYALRAQDAAVGK